MFSSGLSPGVTCGPIRNTLGLGATNGSPRMRLRLFERLGRLVSWRFGSQGERDGRSRDSRAAGAEASGRHRRTPAAASPRDRAVAGGRGARRSRASRCSRRRGCQPPAGSAAPRHAPPRLAPRTAGVRPAARPCRRCRGTTRRARAAASGGRGSGRRHSAPHRSTRPRARNPMRTRLPPRQDGAAQAPRQPWYQVVGGPPAARRLAGRRARPARRPGRELAAARNGAAAKKAQAKAATTPAERHPRAAAVRRAAPAQPPGDGRRAAELRTA